MTILVTGATGTVGRHLVVRAQRVGVSTITMPGGGRAESPLEGAVRASDLRGTRTTRRGRARPTVETLLGIYGDVPEFGCTMTDTVGDVTGRQARTFAEWSD